MRYGSIDLPYSLLCMAIWTGRLLSGVSGLCRNIFLKENIKHVICKWMGNSWAIMFLRQEEED